MEEMVGPLMAAIADKVRQKDLVAWCFLGCGVLYNAKKILHHTASVRNVSQNVKVKECFSALGADTFQDHAISIGELELLRTIRICIC